MLKEEGDAVKAGNVLARLDTRPLELAIAQRKAAIAQQEAVVAKLHNGSRPEEITQAAAQAESLAAAENNARLLPAYGIASCRRCGKQAKCR